MVLLITRGLPDAVRERADREFFTRALNLQGKFDASELLRHLADVDAILCTPADKFDAGMINQLPNSVRVIGTFSVGLEHIDLAAALARDIQVCHTPEVLSVATAELSLTLMLMAARRAGEGERLLRAGKWSGLTPDFHLGIGVAAKTLGIFGMGRIGRELAAMARGLRMEIHYRNRSRLAPHLEAGATYHDNDTQFLGVCDFLSINVPGGEPTRHWLNAERIDMLKPGAVVVNTGRGSSIDDAALIAALKSGRVAAAGLDVYAEEPLVNPGYLTLENVVLLPHIGSATVETRNAMGFLALQGIAAVVGTRQSGR